MKPIALFVTLTALAGGFVFDAESYGQARRPTAVLPGSNYEIAWDLTTHHMNVIGVTPVQDTLLWVSSGGRALVEDTNMILIYDLRTQTLVDSFFQDNGTLWGYVAITYDAAEDRVYGGIEGSILHAIDATSHELAASYTLSGPSVPYNAAGLAVDGDSLYMSAAHDWRFFKASKTGTNCHLVPGVSGFGIALDHTHGRAYVTSYGRNTFRTYSFPDWNLLFTTTVREVLYDAGCEIAPGDSLLLAVNQDEPDPDQVLALRMFEGPDDAGMDAIVSPVANIPEGRTRLQARIRNFGQYQLGEVPIHCWIDSAGTRVHEAGFTTSGVLFPGDTVTVQLVPDWFTGPVGSRYKVTMFTACDGDSNRANDTLYDSTEVVGIAEQEERVVLGPTPLVSVSRGVLMLTGTHPAEFVDITGRKVMDLMPGSNDIRHVAPGIYFLRSAEGGEPSAVRKVIVQR